MKTKEINVWVNPENIKSTDILDVYVDKDKYHREWISNPFKAKLVIEIPEKKIEITESEMDKVRKLILKTNHLSKNEKYALFKKRLGF